MKLAELDPTWCTTTEKRHGMGITFQCPVHLQHRIAVWFSNPLDGGAPAPGDPGDTRWLRIGETFDTLTLDPSVHVIDVQPDGARVTHWHGVVQQGEVRNA